MKRNADFPIQGDIAFVPVTKAEAKGLKHRIEYQGSVTVGYGEVTGHNHRIHGNLALASSEAFDQAGVDQFSRDGSGPELYVIPGGKDVECLHEEHDKVVLKEGQTYRIVRQQEFEDDEWQAVAD